MESIERHNIQYEETIHKQRIPSGQGIINTTSQYKEKTFKEVVGTNNANGTELAEIEIPEGFIFACYYIQYACNEGRSIAVCTVDDAASLGDASQAERFVFGDDNVGLHADHGIEHPLFVVDNSAGTAAIDMLVYAPHTVFNVTNDPATSYFQGHIAGICYKGKIETRGES